jgi:hypothetical protein
VYAGLYRTQFAPQAALRSFLEAGNIPLDQLTSGRIEGLLSVVDQ